MNKKWIAVSIIVFFIFLLATLPARVAVKWLPPEAGVNAVGVSGTLWSGNAANVSIKQQSVDGVTWALNPFYFFTGKLGGTLHVNNQDIKGKTDFAVNMEKQIHLSNSNFTFDAATLSTYLPIKTVSLSGKIRTSINDITFSEANGPQHVDATIYWLKSQIAFAGQEVKLGQFTVEATSQADNSVLLSLKPTKNTVDAKGSAVLKWPQQIELDLSVSEQVPEALKQSIMFLKKADNNRRTLQMTIPLSRVLNQR